MRFGVTEPIRHGTIRAVDDTGTSGVENTGYGLFILQNNNRTSDRDAGYVRAGRGVRG